jgi:hypothetical protein
MPSDKLELLLADGYDLRPTLKDGLPEELAGSAPPPDKVPRGVDAHRLDEPDREPNDLSRQRWGVIAPEGPAGDGALAAIAPLVRMREEEQGAKAFVYRVPPAMSLEDAARWKNHVLRDARVPQSERPRYLLILGDLDQVSVELSHVLANGSFVGRARFAALDDYAKYAQKVVRWARTPSDADRADALFYAADDGTDATIQGRSKLVDPAADMAQTGGGQRRFPANVVRPASVDRADEFLGVVGATARPAVLLSMSHGLGRPNRGWRSADDQRRLQGALTIGSGGGRDALLTADRVRSGPFLPGGLWFCVACFGAGTPAKSAFYPWLSELARLDGYTQILAQVIASLPADGEPPFLAAMPQAALANDDGPLGVIGHLDLTWTYSFVDPDRRTQSCAHRIFGAVEAMARSSRAGVALDTLMRAYREVNDELVSGFQAQEEARVWKQPYQVDPRKRGNAFMLRNDLRGYVLLGDPAARLPLRGTEVAPAPPRSPAEPLPALTISPASDPARDVAKLEAAVLAVIAGSPDVTALAATCGVTREELERLVEVYKAAGRAAIARGA